MNPEDFDTAGQDNTQVSTDGQAVAPEDQQAADAAFEAGFAGAHSAEPEHQPEAPSEPVYAGYKESELKALLARIPEIDGLKQRESKVFGTVGQLKQAFDGFRAQPTAQSGTPISLSADKLARLNAEFPELASLIAEDLNGVILGAGQSGGMDQAAVDGIVAQKLEGLNQTFETRLLTAMHKDWRKVVQSTEFDTWTATLPEETRSQLAESWNAEFIAEQIDAFKDAQATATRTKQTNQRRLEAAITPRGNTAAPPAPSEDDAFLAGFRSVRGK